MARKTDLTEELTLEEVKQEILRDYGGEEAERQSTKE